MRLDQYPLAERKLVFRILHGALVRHPELLDSDLLAELQRQLQTAAREQGVDIADHGAWDAWLGNPGAACQVRVAGRRVLG